MYTRFGSMTINTIGYQLTASIVIAVDTIKFHVSQIKISLSSIQRIFCRGQLPHRIIIECYFNRFWFAYAQLPKQISSERKGDDQETEKTQDVIHNDVLSKDEYFLKQRKEPSLETKKP
jgi:hypothetical protein